MRVGRGVEEAKQRGGNPTRALGVTPQTMPLLLCSSSSQWRLFVPKVDVTHSTTAVNEMEVEEKAINGQGGSAGKKACRRLRAGWPEIWVRHPHLFLPVLFFNSSSAPPCLLRASFLLDRGSRRPNGYADPIRTACPSLVWLGLQGPHLPVIKFLLPSRRRFNGKGGGLRPCSSASVLDQSSYGVSRSAWGTRQAVFSSELRCFRAAYAETP